ncbi:hypothetical protein TrVE_jg11296 [Triparma verrucosa]|uniref:AMP-dependent synthetase/ligase domain-containing protein n=1 Tax=Triparma verrucosa TaxID=1606542 RepID=A0A9W6Z8L1_9STRA|nr:hypothetical protein TrVE_jg11296 [Triparma verrucosa]
MPNWSFMSHAWLLVAVLSLLLLHCSSFIVSNGGGVGLNGLNSAQHNLLRNLDIISPFRHHQLPLQRTTDTVSTLKSSTTLFSVAPNKGSPLSPDDLQILYDNSTGSLDSTLSPSTGASRVKATNLAPSEPSSSDPLIASLQRSRKSLVNCPQIWSETAKHVPNSPALVDNYNCDVKTTYTFREMEEMVDKASNVFRSLGVKRGVNAAIFGENSAKWLVADHGVQGAGGASAVRGADAPPDEIRYIYQHSDSIIAILQGPALLKKLAVDAEKEGIGSPLGLVSKNGGVEEVVLMHREKLDLQQIISDHPNLSKLKITFLDDLLASAHVVSPPPHSTVLSTDPATIVYTSGTTGRPKGVVLTHSNLLHQMDHRLSPSNAYEESEPLPNETFLSLLPVWHITERTFELWVATRGAKVVYSSIRTFKNDLEKWKPEWMVLVPRVLEKVASGVQAKFNAGSFVQRKIVALVTAAGLKRNASLRILNGLVEASAPPGLKAKLKARLKVMLLNPVCAVGDKLVWSKVKNGFGGNQKVIISGGSALSEGLERFYDLAGIKIIVGYGLTETSPLVAHRRLDCNLNVGGCVGKETYSTIVKVVDEVTRQEKEQGEIGVVLAKGPQVMREYYKDEEATKKAIDEQGFFDTGDLGKINVATGDLILTGRCKDTIVLSNGENIEPQPIEDKILSTSGIIEQVMLMGDDGRRLIAVTVVDLPGLAEKGLVTKEEKDKYQKLVDIMNDPKFEREEADNAKIELERLGSKLRSDPAVVSAVVADLKAASGTSAGFRKWESVQDAYIVVEPFAMSNGLLTQSFKVKRAQVAEAYGEGN